MLTDSSRGFEVWPWVAIRFDYALWGQAYLPHSASFYQTGDWKPLAFWRVVY